MSKSHTAIEQKICLVTGSPFNVGILLDKRLKDSLENPMITGWGFSPEVVEKFEEGYIALVAIDVEKSKMTNDTVQPQDAYRLGKIAYVRKAIAEEILPGENIKNFSFVPEEVYLRLVEMSSEETPLD